MNKLAILLISCLCINIALADETKSILLNKGQPAPYDGLLFTPDAAKEMRLKLLDLDYQQNLNKNLNIEIADYNQRVNNYQQENADLSKRLESSNASFFEKTGMFILGALTATLVAYGVYKTR